MTETRSQGGESPKDRLKIGLLSFRHPTDDSVGVANVVSRLSRLFRESGHEVWVYYPLHAGEVAGPETWEGVHAVALPLERRTRFPLGLEKEISRKMARSLRKDLDVVIVNNEFGAYLGDARTSAGSQAPAPLRVVVLHGLALHFMTLGKNARPPGVRQRLGYYLDVWALRALEKRSLRRADLLFACSRSVADDAVATYGVSREKIRVIYNGTDPRPLRSDTDKACARRTLNLKPEEGYVAFVGRDPHRKGLDVAVGAVRLLRKRGVPVSLLNVGNDAETGGGVLSFGKVSEEKKQAVLLASDVFILPSIYEGFPAAIQEAAAHGLPVVTSRRSGIDMGIPGTDYALTGDNTSEEYARVLGNLLADPASLERMGHSGRVALGSRSYRDQAIDYLKTIREGMRLP